MSAEGESPFALLAREAIIRRLAYDVTSYNQQLSDWKFSLVQINNPQHPDRIHLKVFAFPPQRVNPEWDWTQNIVRERISQSLTEVHDIARKAGYNPPIHMDDPWVTHMPSDMEKQLQNLENKGDFTIRVRLQSEADQKALADVVVDAQKTETLVQKKESFWSRKWKKAKETVKEWVKPETLVPAAVKTAATVGTLSLLMDAHSLLHGPPKGVFGALHSLNTHLSQPRYTSEGTKGRVVVSRNPDGTFNEQVTYFSAGYNSRAVRQEIVAGTVASRSP